jgi:glutathione S-transferase
VPAIDDGGFVMWETAAINLYLAETYKNSFYPSTAQSRGLDVLREHRSRTGVDNAVPKSDFLPPEQRNETLAVQAEQTLRAKLAILEDQLAKTPFLGGDTWNMADFIACVLYVLTHLKSDLTDYPKLDVWLAGSLNRPAAQVARKLRE